MDRSMVRTGGRAGNPGPLHAQAIRHPAATGLLAWHLGLGGWLRLAPQLTDHWAALDRAPQVCRGHVAARATAAGRVAAALARLLGCPFGPVRGDGIAMSVHVRLAQNGRALHWQRSYAIPGRPPMVVRSVMGTLPDGRLAEIFPAGLGVALRLEERDGGFAFTSTGLVWRLFGRYLSIPHRFGPGRLTVAERCDPDGTHHLALTVVHPRLGEIYRLEGRYRVQAAMTSCALGGFAPAAPPEDTTATPGLFLRGDVSGHSESPDR
ncbi:MAG: DUF4166 domain-containing protein [Rhodospirillaceae bacterium]|nr:DUF4166 domain-containing protein [Rhodospirillaceae bacterium]